MAAQHGSAFPHTQQTEGFCQPRISFVEPPPVIAYTQNHAICLLFQIHFNRGAFGMARNIRQRFLKNAEQGGGNVRRHRYLMGGQKEPAGDAGAGLKFLHLPFHGGRQTQIQNTRPERGGDSADGFDEVISQLYRGPDSFLNLPVSGGHSAGQPGDIHFHGGERLTQVIVNFAGDPGPLVFQNGKLMRR